MKLQDCRVAKVEGKLHVRADNLSSSRLSHGYFHKVEYYQKYSISSRLNTLGFFIQPLFRYRAILVFLIARISRTCRLSELQLNRLSGLCTRT